MVLHNSFLKFDFAYIMVFLWQYSKKIYRKIPKSSKIYIKCQILNRLGFNNYWILLHEINFHWRISMSVNTFPLQVFDFGVSLSAIVLNTHKYLFVTKFHNDWVQIVDFLIKAYFCSSSHLPSPVCNMVTLVLLMLAIEESKERLMKFIKRCHALQPLLKIKCTF